MGGAEWVQKKKQQTIPDWNRLKTVPIKNRVADVGWPDINQATSADELELWTELDYMVLCELAPCSIYASLEWQVSTAVIEAKQASIKYFLPLPSNGKRTILLIAFPLSQHQFIFIPSPVASGYDFTAPFALQLSSLLFTQPPKKRKSTNHFLILTPGSVSVVRQ